MVLAKGRTEMKRKDLFHHQELDTQQEEKDLQNERTIIQDFILTKSWMANRDPSKNAYQCQFPFLGKLTRGKEGVKNNNDEKNSVTSETDYQEKF